MNTQACPAVLPHPAATAALLAALALASQSAPGLRAQSVGVTGFDDRGWNADDVRLDANNPSTSHNNIVNGTTHAPAASSVRNDEAVAALLDWRDTYGSFGNLGGIAFSGGANGNGKSTLGVIDTSTGFAATADALGSGFTAAYRWQNTDTVAPGIAFKIGIQSTAWADSQAGFTAARSGESTWDLLLVFDPTQPGNTPGNTTTNGAFVSSLIDHSTGRFFLFGQAGNTHFSAPGATVAKTLAEWQSDPVWSPLLFGAGAKITNTQFGMGSGNANASGILDHASVSYLQSGARIDFVDALRYSGPDPDFGTAANWGGVAPDSALNLIVEQNASLDVAGAQSARSLGILSGTTTLNLGASASLTLNPAENGTLSAARGATLSVQGPGTLQAATIESAGVVDLASTVQLDGGAIAHPVRDGAPGATSRYGLVVAEGGAVNLLSGANVTLTNNTGANGLKTLVRVGEVSGYSGPGVLGIAAGSSLALGSLHGTNSWGALHVGDWGAQGRVDQTGGSVDIFGALNIGNEGGTGVYNLSGGAINIRRPVSDNGALIIGRATNNRVASGTLNVAGGTLTLGASGGATGNVAMVLGGLSDDVAAYANASGTVNQTGGIVRFQNAVLKFGRGTGTYNLDGGTLEIGGANALSATPNGTYAFNFGGTLKVINSNLSASINANLVATKTSVIDTNGLDATWSGNLVGAGLHQIDFGGSALAKTGAGTLTFAGNGATTRVLDTFATIGGSVRQTAGATSAVEFMVGSGVTESVGNTGTFLMDGGTLTINPSTRADNVTAVSGSFRVGDFGGSGVFTQAAGTVTIADNGALNIGNQGGSGTYNLQGGSLVLNNGLHVVGRSSATNPNASQGVLNLSGGSLTVQNGGSLFLGNNVAHAASGFSAALNQTGGVLHFAAGSNFYLSAFTTGAYTLSGGTLEIGGASLKPNYNGNGDGGAFTLAGGTIKVVGSHLATSANALLADGTADRTVASRIDTNGLGATWSGALTGAQGGLVKTGLGDLTLSGDVARSIGYLNSDQGAILHTAGTTQTTEFVVGSNYGAMNGAFTLSGGVIDVSGATAAAPTPSFRVGDWGGTGAFTQSGGVINAYGSVNLGNRGGTGAYTLSGGTFNVGEGVTDDSSAFILGRGRIADATATTGVFNATGGTLRLFANAPLLVGGDTFSAAENARSHGTFTQSGTARVIVDSYISIGANGTGAYHLDGGTLEIGGANAIRAGAGSATFSLGGGSLKIVGSNFTSSVRPALAASTTSTVDTGALNATFSGGLSGTGNLLKTGSGKLTVAGATSTGALTIVAGTAEFTGSSLGFQSITVQRGALLSGTGNLALATDSVLTIQIGGLSDFGKVDVGSTFNAANATLNVVFVNGYTPAFGDTFDLFDFTSFGGSFAQVNISPIGGDMWDISQLMEDGSFTLGVIPEPAAFAALAALGALGAAVARRRRKA